MTHIEQELDAARAKADAMVHHFTDFDGTPAEVVDDGFDEVWHEVCQLEELTQLRLPLHRTEWGAAMHFGHCPCPGVPEYRWNPPQDDEDDVPPARRYA